MIIGEESIHIMDIAIYLLPLRDFDLPNTSGIEISFISIPKSKCKWYLRPMRKLIGEIDLPIKNMFYMDPFQISISNHFFSIANRFF